MKIARLVPKFDTPDLVNVQVQLQVHSKIDAWCHQKQDAQQATYFFSYKTHISQQLNWKKRTKFSKIFITLKLEMDAVEKKQVQKLQQTKATGLIFLSFGIWAKKSVTLKMSHELSEHHSCWSRNRSLGDPKYSETFVT